MDERQQMERLIENSFLVRVPEIMARGGFTLASAVEQARREDEALCVEMIDWRTERARRATSAMAQVAYQHLRYPVPQGPQANQQ